MLLALSATAIVIVALLWEVAAAEVAEAYERHRARRARVPRRRPTTPAASAAPSSAPARCCARASTTRSGRCTATSASSASGARRPRPERGARRRPGGAPYAYLIYPHKPIVAYLPQTGRLLNEYCVAFPDETRPYGSARLPDSDDVLAKWMALTGDERRLIADGEHAPARPPGRPQAGPPRPVAPDAVGARRLRRRRASR